MRLGQGISANTCATHHGVIVFSFSRVGNRVLPSGALGRMALARGHNYDGDTIITKPKVRNLPKIATK